MDRSEAEELDRLDPLRSWVDEFVATEPGVIYLDANSLGRLPKRTVTRLQDAAAAWATELVRGWDTWIDLPIVVGDRLGAAVLGAAAGQVAVADSTTVNLYKLAAAALDDRPGRRVIVTDRHNFPTDRYVIDGLARARGLDVRHVDADPVGGVRRSDVAAALDAEVALVTFSHVDYRSAAIAEVAAITADAHAAGALTLWDLSHAAGSVPVALDAWDVDLAVGCTYKYLNAGPGAPAWLYVAARLQDRLLPPIWGWFGAADQFAMGPAFEPAPGMRRWLAGTPPVLAIAAVDEGVAVVAEAGMNRVRAKGLALTAYAEKLWGTWLEPLGLGFASPPVRGSHVALTHPEAYRLSRALRDDGVIADHREPDIVRIGLAPLSTRFADVWDGLARLRAQAEAPAGSTPARARVT